GDPLPQVVELPCRVRAGLGEVLLGAALVLEGVLDTAGRVPHPLGALLRNLGLSADGVLDGLGAVLGDTGGVAAGVVDGLLRIPDLPGVRLGRGGGAATRRCRPVLVGRVPLERVPDSGERASEDPDPASGGRGGGGDGGDSGGCGASGGGDGAEDGQRVAGVDGDPHVPVAEPAEGAVDAAGAGVVAVGGDPDPLVPQRLDAGLDLPGLGLCLADLQVDLRVSLLGSEFLKPGVDLVELGDRAVDVRVDLDGLVRKGPADIAAEAGGGLASSLLLEQHLNIRRPDLESALCHQRAFRTSKTSGNAI